MLAHELDLDLDAFEGPFDLLLTLVLKDELALADVDIAGIVLAFCERLAAEERLDLDACGEFLVLVAALLELKARGLFPEEEAELAELEPEEAAEELARRRFDLDAELAGLPRLEQASAFLAVLELRKADEIAIEQAAPFAPIRIRTIDRELGTARSRDRLSACPAPAT